MNTKIQWNEFKKWPVTQKSGRLFFEQGRYTVKILNLYIILYLYKLQWHLLFIMNPTLYVIIWEYTNTYRKTTIYHIILTDGHPHQLWLRLCGWFCDIKHVIAIRIVFYGWKRTTWSQHLKTQCWLLGLGAWPSWHEWLIKPANPTPNFAQCSLLNLLLHYISPLS